METNEKKTYEEKSSVQIAFRVTPDIKQKFIELSKANGKDMSASVREMVENYVEDHVVEAENNHCP